MTEFAMGPSVAPALHLVALRHHLKRGAVIYDSQDDMKGGYVMREENMTCRTNLADSGGCQWPPVSACQWVTRSTDNIPDHGEQSKDYRLRELYCAVAQQPEVSSQNDQKSDWSDESKSCDADDSFLNANECKSFREEGSKLIADGLHKRDLSVDYEDLTTIEKRPSSNLECQKDDYDQHSPDCNQTNLKRQLEKLGWKTLGRHAENRRKRWAQADPLLEFWKAVSASRYAAPFRRPVALLEDYDTIIRQPMDLSTIRRQLENDESYSLESLRRDLMLMVTNALVYNKKGTETHEMALKLKTHAIKLFEGHHKEMCYSNLKLSPGGNSSKSVAKVTKAKHTLPPCTELPSGTESLRLAPIKKHRTMRRPRLCINNDANGLRSDVAYGAAMDSSSEEEAAAVLICFSSGQSGDEKQALSKSKLGKLESPKKRLKRVEVETDDTSACSVTQREGLFSQTDQFLVCSEVSFMSAGPSPATSIRGVDNRTMSGEPEKYVYMTAIEPSQTKKFEKLGLSVNNQAPVGTASVSGEENFPGSRRSERTCMGLKHKWQERWRMQSAASSENSGSLQPSSEPIASNPCGDKYAMDDGSGAETNYRPFPQGIEYKCTKSRKLPEA